jgi:ketosteroid isomerase-like protein
MKISLLTSLMIAGLATMAFGAGAESDLKELTQKWLDAYVKGDVAALKAIEADDWTFVDSDGAIVSKAKDIKEVEDKTFVCKSASASDLKVKMMGDNHASVAGLIKMSGTYKGEDFSGEYRSLDIFEKKDGKWQAIYSQITKVDKG